MKSKRDLRGAERGVAHSEAQGGKGVTGEQRQERTKRNWGQKTEDLTWGYKMPQGQLFVLEIS